MSEFFHFLAAHWLLSAAFIIVLAITAAVEWRDKEQNTSHHIDTQSTINMMNRNQATVIDLREASAYKQGHIIGAKNIPLNELNADNKELKKISSEKIILVNEQGIIKATTKQEIKKINFKEVNILKGGMQAWKTADLPLSKNDKNDKNQKK
jgi:rhodanese-related sulfurtransferase